DSGCVAVKVAVDEKTDEVLGVARLHRIAKSKSGEYAVLVRSALQGQGLGWELMQAVIREARTAGLEHVEGLVLSDNERMLHMCQELGFDIKEAGEPGVRIARLAL
ncbi:MAG: GNAT family N-acetyltransferase, partial [Pseudolabrys sp.]|nr:GNAT family N-acetyltransferase [Pseudolabrys sp.]